METDSALRCRWSNRPSVGIRTRAAVYARGRRLMLHPTFMTDLFADLDALVPRDLDRADSRAYEKHTVRELRRVLSGLDEDTLVAVDAVDLVGSRPDTLVVFRYHHRPQYVGRQPGLVAGQRAEIARFWEFAMEPYDALPGWLDSPRTLAACIGNAFEAAELTLADPHTLAAIGRPPRVFPRLYTLTHGRLPEEQP